VTYFQRGLADVFTRRGRDSSHGLGSHPSQDVAKPFIGLCCSCEAAASVSDGLRSIESNG
jgi:hypothetical protein